VKVMHCWCLGYFNSAIDVLFNIDLAV